MQNMQLLVLYNVVFKKTKLKCGKWVHHSYNYESAVQKFEFPAKNYNEKFSYIPTKTHSL